LSSILRALKKLESDPRQREETRPLDSKFVTLADTSPQKTSTGIIMMVVGTGIVCGLVILAGWWLFSEKTRPPSIAPQEISRHSLQQPETDPILTKETSPPESPAVAVAPVKPAADILAPSKTTSPVPGSTPVKTLQPLPPPMEQKAVVPVNERAAAIQVDATPSPKIMKLVPAEKDTVAPTRAPEVSAVVKANEIPALNDPGMRLQAITWSKDPQKRIVVINNRILRQGEEVLDYRIDAINQDDVVLSDGGEKWKLLFRIK